MQRAIVMAASKARKKLSQQKSGRYPFHFATTYLRQDHLPSPT